MCKGGDGGARLSIAIAKLRPTVQGALKRSDPQGDAQSKKYNLLRLKTDKLLFFNSVGQVDLHEYIF